MRDRFKTPTAKDTMTGLRAAPKLLLDKEQRLFRSVSPIVELGAYEALWDAEGASFKKLAELFRHYPDAAPSDFVGEKESRQYADKVLAIFKKRAIADFGVRLHGAGEYPDRLRDADDPVEFLYFQGDWDLAHAPKQIAIVGTREPTDEGRRRTRKLARLLVKDGYVIVSGLARGIDTEAHTAAIDAGGSTIAVLGTPLSETYPRENAELQRTIARDHLLVTQVPVCRYTRQLWTGNRFFFPARNVTMSALTDATVIVEAGETSGTFVQARAALAQKRKLFILDSCFKNRKLTWPKRFQEQGAIRVSDYEDIAAHLG